MKIIKINIIILVLLSSAYSNNSIFFNPRFKIGSNINRLIPLDKSTHSAPIKHYYRPGFVLGVGNKIYLHKNFTWISDLYYNRTLSMYKYAPYAMVKPAYQIYINNYFRVSNLIGYEFGKSFNFSIGIDIGLLTKSTYNVIVNKNDNVFDKFAENFTNNLPFIDYSSCFRLSRKVDIYNVSFKVELIYLKSFTKFKNYHFDEEFLNKEVQIVLSKTLRIKG